MQNTSLGLEAEIADLLAELSDVQDELLDVLIRKRDAMAEGNEAAMNELVPREKELQDRLQACHDQRAALLEQGRQRGLPADNLGNLVSGFPAEQRGDLPKRVQETSSRMRLLQHHSLTNWVLAQRSLLHLSQLLEIIATGGRLQPTYGKGHADTSSGALVDREA